MSVDSTPVCPVCRSNSTRTVFKNIPFRHRIQAIERNHANKVQLCNCCGCLSRYPRPDQQSTDIEQWGNFYYTPDLSKPLDEEEAKACAEQHFDQIQKLHYDQMRTLMCTLFDPKESNRWLDVGSVGYPTTFDDFDFTTIEPSQSAVAFGRSQFNSEKIVHGDLIHNQLEGKFDGVLMMDSLYCMENPRDGIRAAADLLIEGGVLIITINNFLSGCGNQGDTRGSFDCIEDAFGLAIVLTEFNTPALKTVASEFGLILEHCTMQPSVQLYGSREILIFRKRSNQLVVNNDELVRSYGFGAKLSEFWLASLLERFRIESTVSLNSINRKSAILLAPTALLNEISVLHPLSEIGAKIPVNSPEADISAVLEVINKAGVDSFDLYFVGIENQIVIEFEKDLPVGLNLYVESTNYKTPTIAMEYDGLAVFGKSIRFKPLGQPLN